MNDFRLCAARVEFVVLCARRESYPRVTIVSCPARARVVWGRDLRCYAVASCEIVTYYCVGNGLVYKQLPSFAYSSCDPRLSREGQECMVGVCRRF